MSSLRKVLLAGVIVAIGLGAAMQFRKPSGPPRVDELVSSNVTFRDEPSHQPAPESANHPGPRQGVPLPSGIEISKSDIVKDIFVERPRMPAIEDRGGVPASVPRLETLEDRATVVQSQPSLSRTPMIPSTFQRGLRPELPQITGTVKDRVSDFTAKQTEKKPVAAPIRNADSNPPTHFAKQRALRAHTIVNGDTLARLAQRYLGRSDRYREIYELNQDVLEDPSVLPLGAKLRIPPKETSDTADPSPIISDEENVTVPRRSPQLVPLPTDIFFQGR